MDDSLMCAASVASCDLAGFSIDVCGTDTDAGVFYGTSSLPETASGFTFTATSTPAVLTQETTH